MNPNRRPQRKDTPLMEQGEINLWDETRRIGSLKQGCPRCDYGIASIYRFVTREGKRAYYQAKCGQCYFEMPDEPHPDCKAVVRAWNLAVKLGEQTT